MSSKKITSTSMKPSFVQYFANEPTRKGGQVGVEESRTLTAKWSPAIAKTRAEQKKFVRFSPSAVGDTKTRATSSQPAVLPMTGFTTILQGTKNAKAPGGRKPKVVFLSHIPVDWLVAKMNSLKGSSIVRDAAEFREWLVERSQTNIPGTPSGSYHFPLRMSGPAQNVQAALKSYGIDFARLLTRGQPGAGFNATNQEIIDEFSFHGTTEILNENGDEVQIEQNIDYEGWVQEHPYGQLYMDELARRQEESKALEIRGAAGTPNLSLHELHYAAERLRAIREKAVRRDMVVSAHISKATGQVTWRKATMDTTGKAAVSSSAFLKRLPSAVAKVRSNVVRTDGEENISRSVTLVLQNGTLTTGDTGRSKVLQEGQSDYAVVPGFSYTDETGVAQEIEEGDLVIPLSKREKVDGKMETKASYRPSAVVDAFATALASLVDEEQAREIVRDLRRQITEKQNARREAQAKKKSSTTKRVPRLLYGEGEEQVEQGPEAQTTEQVEQPESSEEEGSASS